MRDDSSAVNEDAMKDAMKAVLVEKMSSRKAAGRFGVNRNTLFSRMKKKIKKQISEKQDNGDEDASSPTDDSGNEDDGGIEEVIRAPLPYANKFATMQVFTQEQ